MDVKALKNFRANLLCSLEARDLSYRGFAEMCGLTYIYIHRIVNPNENGKPEPSLEVCERIAVALGYDLAEMLANPKEFKQKELTAV